MTALEFFEKLKSFGQLDENTNYQEWIDKRIENKYPVEGNLLEAYKNVSELTIGGLSDYFRIMMAESGTPVWEEERKKDEPKEIQVHFIKKKK